MFSLLIISNELKPCVSAGPQLRTRICGYGSALVAECFDHILQIEEPKNEREKEWYDQVRATRLYPKK